MKFDLNVAGLEKVVWVECEAPFAFLALSLLLISYSALRLATRVNARTNMLQLLQCIASNPYNRRCVSRTYDHLR